MAKFIQRAAGDEPAPLDDADFVAQALGHIQHMRGEKHRAAAVGMAAHLFLKHEHALRVQAHHGLVQHPDAGLVDERAGDGQLLLHAAGVAADLLVGGVLQLKQRQVFFNVALAACSVHPVDIRHEIEVIHAGEAFVHVERVRDVTKAALGRDGIARHVDAVEHNTPAVGRKDAGEQLDGGGFAGAVGANKAEHLALLDLHIQAIHGLHLASGIGLGHVFKLDHGFPSSYKGFFG